MRSLLIGLGSDVICSHVLAQRKPREQQKKKIAKKEEKKKKNRKGQTCTTGYEVEHERYIRDVGIVVAMDVSFLQRGKGDQLC